MNFTFGNDDLFEQLSPQFWLSANILSPKFPNIDLTFVLASMLAQIILF